MARGGREKDRDDPERRCIATGESQPKAGLVRFVIGPEAVVVPDVAGRLPGRGIYVSASRAAIEKAAAKGLFSRAAKAPVTAPAGLADTVEAALVRRLTETVSMARKAGEAVCGFEKVKGWLETGQAAILIQASDGSERGKGKLYPPDGPETLIGCMTAGELGLSFARERAIHAALAAGRLAERAVEEAARLAGMRSIAPNGRDGGRSAGKEQKA